MHHIHGFGLKENIVLLIVRSKPTDTSDPKAKRPHCTGFFQLIHTWNAATKNGNGQQTASVVQARPTMPAFASNNNNNIYYDNNII